MTRIHKTLIFTVFLTAVCLLALSVQTASASAKVNFSVIGYDDHYKKCSGSCRYFSVIARGSNLRLGTNGTICWLGSCKGGKVLSGSQGRFILAEYNNVGPYRCGTPTNVSLSYQGGRYSGTTRIRC